jgi:membrane protein DedA with SNARE-associated domain
VEDFVVNVVRSMGPIGIALLTFAENVFPPIPSEVIMPLAGYVSARDEGIGSFAAAAVAGTLGSFAGAVGWYLLGRRMGEERIERWIERHGHWLTLRVEHVDRAQRWFLRHGKGAVFFGRLVPGLRTLISLPAGFTGMHPAPFLLMTFLGTAIWTTGLTFAGRVLGQRWQAAGDYVGWASWVVIGGVAVIWGWRVLQGKGKRNR